MTMARTPPPELQWYENGKRKEKKFDSIEQLIRFANKLERKKSFEGFIGFPWWKR